jgi:hypothetical protein
MKPTKKSIVSLILILFLTLVRKHFTKLFLLEKDFKEASSLASLSSTKSILF